MSILDRKADLLNVLAAGKGQPEEAISLLIKYAKEDPAFLLKSIRDLVEIKIDHMIMIALAALTANAPTNFIVRTSTIEDIVVCLSQYNAEDLFSYVEFLRSKELGRGFGARPQKWLREILENWTQTELSEYLEKFPQETSTLISLVHPRWKTQMGDIVRQFFQDKSAPLLC